jgi:diadenosine tetraphosphate (Ap4A) HIT family hydrolase
MHFQKKFKISDLKIFESKFWIWSLRPYQSTIGSGILSLKRECPTLSLIQTEEYIDLQHITSCIEKTLGNSFDYAVINYLALMMFDKQVHFHVIPRYNRIVNWNNSIWEDTNWPSVPQLSGHDTEFSSLISIKNYLISNLEED